MCMTTGTRRAASGRESAPALLAAIALQQLVQLPLLTSAKLVAPNLRPFRGWTSWDLSALTETYGENYGHQWLNSTNILAQSAALAASGLQAQGGFDHINIDSFWSDNPTQAVDKYGRWRTNLTRFPEARLTVQQHH